MSQTRPETRYELVTLEGGHWGPFASELEARVTAARLAARGEAGGLILQWCDGRQVRCLPLYPGRQPQDAGQDLSVPLPGNSVALPVRSALAAEHGSGLIGVAVVTVVVTVAVTVAAGLLAWQWLAA